MVLVERQASGVTILDLGGKLTLSDGEAELRALAVRLIEEGRLRILINLGQVPYIDSSGIGALMEIYKRAAAAGGTVKLLNPHRRVYDVLHLVKLDSVFDVHADEERAIESF